MKKVLGRRGKKVCRLCRGAKETWEYIWEICGERKREKKKLIIRDNKKDIRRRGEEWMERIKESKERM
jgi:recombinational DNA repair protein RecR